MVVQFFEDSIKLTFKRAHGAMEKHAKVSTSKQFKPRFNKSEILQRFGANKVLINGSKAKL